MSKPKQKRRRDEFTVEEAKVRALLNEWDPIPGSPDHEYDCLTHSLISALHRGAQHQEIAVLIRRHLSEHMGINEPQEEIDRVAEFISTWWKRRHLKREQDT
jgi:hypothetical protein